jgi:hypothetical protein
MKRLTRNRRLTPEEAAKYKAIREQVTQERNRSRVKGDKSIGGTEAGAALRVMASAGKCSVDVAGADCRNGDSCRGGADEWH